MTPETEDDDRCLSGRCDEIEECGACSGTGDNGYTDCYSCGGTGERTPEHCCVCGGSPYCVCCRTCKASCVGDCRCPIETERGGKTVTV